MRLKRPGFPDNTNKQKLCYDQVCKNKLLQNFFYYLIPRYLALISLLSPGVDLTGVLVKAKFKKGLRKQIKIALVPCHGIEIGRASCRERV